MERSGPYRSKRYLAWAKGRSAMCCVCNQHMGSQLHHFGERGMGQKGSDLWVCRVCPACHERVAGKRRVAHERDGALDWWCDILEDALGLATAYIEHLEHMVGGNGDEEAETF